MYSSLQRFFALCPLIGCYTLALGQQAAAAFPWATAISRTGWNVTADSYQAGYEPENVIDSNTSRIWQTQDGAALPHFIQFDMLKSYVVNGISYVPRQDDSRDGNIGQHTVSLSNDGVEWGSPVSFGSFQNSNETKDIFFSSAPARYVRLVARSEGQGLQSSSVAEFNVYSPDPSQDGTTFAAPPTSQGQWGPSIVLPVVGGAVALRPDNTLVFWSAYMPSSYTLPGPLGLMGSGMTQTAVWDPSGQAVSQVTVSNTAHDMFCPGVSVDANGEIVVTGGDDSRKTSIFDPASSGWVTGPEMNIGRGYQSSCTLQDGRIFIIGGSWNGGLGGKDGEIFDGNTWTQLPGAVAAPLLTQDAGGADRSDNHAWLFSWTENSVFQAGPSSAMNWYNVSGNGSVTAAGTRASDTDSMCGNAVMFDAVQGLILTAGGSPSYQNSAATANAHLIKLGAVDANPTVTSLPSMQYQRAFGNGVALPNGQVLVIGGQAFAQPFTDTTATFPAELFDPGTGTWSTMAPIAVPRTYHSVALLLPDATVVSAGGGICGPDSANCVTGEGWNHYDGQIYRPPYLFNADGSAAARPTISSASPLSLKPGATLTVTTDVAATFSMIRYGAATHTTNTDQRRVPLTATASGLTYTIVLPSDAGILVPGYWMLFAINAAGVPSVSTQIKVLLA